MRILIFILGSFMIASCGSKQTYQGEGMANYPDMVSILKDNVLPYQQGAYRYRQVITEKGKSDTIILRADQVDWNAIKKPFLKADIYKKEFDRMYSLNFFEDEYAQSKTWLFTSLNKKANTSRISLNVRNEDDAILSLYAETNDVGLLYSTSYKLLLATGKTIQIQEKSKKPFSETKHSITTLTFLN